MPDTAPALNIVFHGGAAAPFMDSVAALLATAPHMTAVSEAVDRPGEREAAHANAGAAAQALQQSQWRLAQKAQRAPVAARRARAAGVLGRLPIINDAIKNVAASAYG